MYVKGSSQIMNECVPDNSGFIVQVGKFVAPRIQGSIVDVGQRLRTVPKGALVHTRKGVWYRSSSEFHKLNGAVTIYD